MPPMRLWRGAVRCGWRRLEQTLDRTSTQEERVMANVNLDYHKVEDLWD